MSIIPKVKNLPDHYNGSSLSGFNLIFNFPIPNAQILCQIKETADGNPVHEWKTGVNIQVLDVNTGSVYFEKINEFITNPGKYIYDCQMTLEDGSCETYITGKQTVLQDISR